MPIHQITIEDRVILFTDVHDFSIVAKTLGRGQLLAFFQEIYETLGDIIVAHQGEIVKYIGDALLCLFPANSEVSVIECARKMRAAYAEMVFRRNISHDTELEIGIDAGEVEIGVIGHVSLRQKDVFSEHVNRAAVIGHHRGIAITESVYHAIKNHYATAPLPDRKLKWQEAPLKVWEVVE